MQLLSLFKDLTLYPDNAQELKVLILQFAVQGKLTANWRAENPNIKHASDLLKKIVMYNGEQLKLKKRKLKKLPTDHDSEL